LGARPKGLLVDDPIFIAEHEKALIARAVRTRACEERYDSGLWPLGVTVDLGEDDFGGGQVVSFALVGKCPPVYESLGSVEVDGIPGARLRVIV
jgi:hypothetical protein